MRSMALLVVREFERFGVGFKVRAFSSIGGRARA
jgi:hypothetical protein